MHIDPRLATVLAVILLVAGAVIVITSGESVAVRFLTVDRHARHRDPALLARQRARPHPLRSGAVRARRPFGSPRAGRCCSGSSALRFSSRRWVSRARRRSSAAPATSARRGGRRARGRRRSPAPARAASRRRGRSPPTAAPSANATARRAGVTPTDSASAARRRPDDHAMGHPRVVQRAGGAAGGRIVVVLAREDAAEQHVRRDDRRTAGRERGPHLGALDLVRGGRRCRGAARRRAAAPPARRRWPTRRAAGPAGQFTMAHARARPAVISPPTEATSSSSPRPLIGALA